MSISLAIATFNKDEYILRTIESVYSWVDEIIIVYGSPKDEKIKAIDKFDSQKKVTFHFTDNPPNFHINKQKAIKRCTKDWILQLDTDEVVSKKLGKEIVSTIKDHKDGDPVGYWMPRLNYFLGRPLRKGGQYPDPTIRLYMNGKGHLPAKSVHEQAVVDGPVGHLKNDLLHYPYPTFAVYLHKWLRYGSLEGDKERLSHVQPSLGMFMSYFIFKPTGWFLKTYFRHKGFYDGFPGFVFSLFSSMRFWIEYIKLYERHNSSN